MNARLVLLAICQGLFLTNNVTFIAINGLVGLSMAPVAWMATLPVMGYVVGGALSTGLVARSQRLLGRQRAFQLGLVVAGLAALLCAYAASTRNFWLLCLATGIAGYYNANAGLYRFAAAELADKDWRERAVSWVLAGGLIGAVLGPNLATYTRNLTEVPFTGAYLSLSVVAVIGLVLMSFLRFPPVSEQARAAGGRPLREIMRQPVFIVAALTGALSYGVMNLLMAATPLAMDRCGLPFSDAAFVLEWHVIGMFAPGFFTGGLIKRFGALKVMAVGVLLNGVSVFIALAGTEVANFLLSSFVLGLGWNFIFTGSTTLSLTSYAPQERDRAQGALNFFVFFTLAVSSFSSGVLVTTQGWALLNWGSFLPVVVSGAALAWLALHQRALAANAATRAPL